MRMRGWGVLVGLLLLAACQPVGVPTADPVGLPLGWQRSPDAIVFQADRLLAAPSSVEFDAAIPECTIYGDNRVVWVNYLDGITTQILGDFLTDAQIVGLIDALVTVGRLYTYQIPTPENPAATPPPLTITFAREMLLLNVSGIRHVTDERSGWGEDYYNGALELCRRLATAPALVEPLAGAWLTVIPVPESTEQGVMWDAAAGLRLADADSAAHWIGAELARRVWDYQRRLPNPVLFTEDSRSYRLALQVPGVSRWSPPPP